MKPLKFGTDGVRGVANEGLLPEHAFAIGMAAGRLLHELGLPLRVLLGRDTRRSGTMLGAAIASGLCAAGVEVTALGVAPTGAISMLTRTGDYGLGVVISASHNPAPDNGIKLIAGDGRKLASEHEARILELMGTEFSDRPTGSAIGRIISSQEELERYMAFLESLVPERLDGETIFVDASHGAGFELGVEVFRRLGASVQVIGASPDGDNINLSCGATHPMTLQDAVRGQDALGGVAYDGDADRAVFADSQGRLVNGDRTMAIWAAHWRQQGAFDPPIIVGTVMSNGGFEQYARGNGVQLERADVGDKYVSARMTELGAKVGGEQSGHIIFAERGPTGDGLVTALELFRVLKREERDLASFFDEFANFPQVLINVSVDDKDGWDSREAILLAREAALALVGDSGRFSLRASGTQPMIRVMAESPDLSVRDEAADLVVQALLKELGGSVYSRVDLTYALGD